jgi:RNA polymerase sigma-70 factor (ECF subfamily)
MIETMAEIIQDYQVSTDEQLILMFQKGDLQAYNTLVKRYKNPLFNFIYRYVNDDDISDDVLQETFIRLYKNKHYYKEVAKFSTWIYTIASNLAKTELRRKKRHNLFSINNHMNESKDFDITDSDNNPEENLEKSNLTFHIQKAIKELPESFREAVILRDVQGLEYDEIAEILQTPLGTVKSRINRGRALLSDVLKQFI